MVPHLFSMFLTERQIKLVYVWERLKKFHLSCVVRKELYGLYEEEESSTGVFVCLLFIYFFFIKILLRGIFLARHIVECVIVWHFFFNLMTSTLKRVLVYEVFNTHAHTRFYSNKHILKNKRKNSIKDQTLEVDHLLAIFYRETTGLAVAV